MKKIFLVLFFVAFSLKSFDTRVETTLGENCIRHRLVRNFCDVTLSYLEATKVGQELQVFISVVGDKESLKKLLKVAVDFKDASMDPLAKTPPANSLKILHQHLFTPEQIEVIREAMNTFRARQSENI